MNPTILNSETTNSQLYKPSDFVYILDEFDLSVEYLQNEENSMNEMKKLSLLHLNKINENNLTNIKNRLNDSDTVSNGSSEQKTPDNNIQDFISTGTDKVVVSDLLEVLQGPIPINGLIVIATTNHYDKIKSICPALFRSGRLLPMLFDYPSQTAINQFIKYYFNKDSDIKFKNTLDIPISDLINFIEENSAEEDSYEQFLAYINEHITN